MPAELKVSLLGGIAADIGKMIEISDGKWTPDWEADFDVSQGELLAEFGGRACYQSWSKPNPDRQDNKSYLRHILEVGHFSVLRHAVVCIYVEGVSRSLTHELIRHHVGIDYSQLSQRYVDAEKMDYVIPPAMRGSEEAEDRLEQHWRASIRAYAVEVERLIAEGKTRKQAREAARAFLPGCAETKILVTANLQAWRNFVEQRGTEHADAEIRELAVEVTRHLKLNCPNAFQDLEVCEGGDGITTVCRRPL
jgi:thymidylate synthase (FAD)